MGVIVKGADVELNTEPYVSMDGGAFAKWAYPKGLEASSIEAETAYLDSFYLHPTKDAHSFLFTLQKAFAEHKGICLGPDLIWLLICQGFAEHIKQNSEHFKEQIRGVDQRQTLSVERPDFVKGAKNPWHEVFTEFGDEISEVIGPELQRIIAQKFSTTTPQSATAFEIAFMDSMSRYFDYEIISICGIPKIVIEGTEQDYSQILDALKELGRYELTWWTNKVSQHVQKIVDALQGKENYSFWKSIFEEDGPCGQPEITGWITDFFPYIKVTGIKESVFRDMQAENPLDLGSMNKAPQKSPTVSEFRGVPEELIMADMEPTVVDEGDLFVRKKAKNPILFGHQYKFYMSDFPDGISSVPLKWKYNGTNIDMRLESGFIGIIEDKDEHTLEADINWVVLEEK